jgi:integration host factor subunit beta
MTKSELITTLVNRLPSLRDEDVSFSVSLMLEAIRSTLEKGGRAEIRGFGSFALNYRPPRRGRNPKSGEQVSVPAKYVPHFKPGKELKDRVNTISPIANQDL